MTPNIIPLNPDKEKEFFALVSEYLPDSSFEKIKKYSHIFPRLFLLLEYDGKIIGTAFGWNRKIDFPDDDSFVLNGIAVRAEYHRQGCGRLLLSEFERAAKTYGALAVSLGSAVGYPEDFYLACGYTPTEYKIWENNCPLTKKKFASINDYYSYNDKSGDGFVVMYKKL